MNSGIFYDNSLHPLTCKKIYNAVVIPKALYGCENWFALSSTELLTTECAHRFCIKKMQSPRGPKNLLNVMNHCRS